MRKTEVILLVSVIVLLAFDTGAADVQSAPTNSAEKGSNAAAPDQPRRGPGRFGGPIEIHSITILICTNAHQEHRASSHVQGVCSFYSFHFGIRSLR